MIVIGVDVHKHSLSAVAVDEVGRQLDALETADGEELVSWSKRVGRHRLWALEDCRHVTRGFERTLQRHRQRPVRVPPRLTAPERRRGRVRGKSDLIDALAIARAALREPVLDSPRPEEGRLRELKLLVDHRDDLVDERRRAQQRLRWHLHELDPTLRVPLGALDRSHLARPSQPSARPPRADDPGANRTRARRPLPQPHSLGDRAQPRAAPAGHGDCAAPARAARLRRAHRRQAALRDRPDRPLPLRRTARPPRRRRTTRRQLRQTPTPPPRPRRQPPTQLRPAPHRSHPRPRPPTSAHLSRTQTSRKQEPPRKAPASLNPPLRAY